MSFAALTRLQQGLAALKADHLDRRRRLLDGAQGTHVTIDGQRVVSFCSNDYLGLAADPALIAAAHVALDQCGVGAGAAQEQMVALVAAETEAIAEQALGLIEVEYESLPAVLDPADAMLPAATRIHFHAPVGPLGSPSAPRAASPKAASKARRRRRRPARAPATSPTVGMTPARFDTPVRMNRAVRQDRKLRLSATDFQAAAHSAIETSCSRQTAARPGQPKSFNAV